MTKDTWQYSRSRSKSEKFLEGAIDLHVHPGPHLISSPRSTDPIKTAIEARDAGMRAFAIMDVFNMSVGTAWMVMQVVEGIEVYGGIILNTVFGGMNPRRSKPPCITVPVHASLPLAPIPPFTRRIKRAGLKTANGYC